MEVVGEGGGTGQKWRKEKGDLDRECSKVRDPTRGQSGLTEEGHMDEKERIRKPEVSPASRKA